MSNTMLNLWRKEWREQRWKLALGVLVVGGFTLLGLRARIVPDVAILAMAATISAALLSLLASMDLLAGERANGTLLSLLRLPVRPWRILAAKVAAGAVVCVGPLAVACAIACLLAGGREESTRTVLTLFAVAAALAVTAMIWMLAFGARQPSEARAAIAGIAVLIAWALAVAVYTVFGHSLPRWVMVVHPMSFFVALEEPDAPWLAGVVPVQAALSFALLVWTARRFARPGRSES